MLIWAILSTIKAIHNDDHILHNNISSHNVKYFILMNGFTI
jgi:hypothetical protein